MKIDDLTLNMLKNGTLGTEPLCALVLHLLHKTGSVQDASDDQAALTPLDETDTTSVTDEPPFTVFVREEVKTGVWFRNPFFLRYVDGYEDGELSKFSASSALSLRGLYGIVHYALNGPKRLRGNVDFMSNNYNAAGYSILSVRSPVYFKREERHLEAEGYGLKILSKGHNYVEERVAGNCEAEHTLILKTEPVKKVLWKGSSRKHKGYRLTYFHVIEKILTDYKKTGRLDLDLI